MNNHGIICKNNNMIIFLLILMTSVFILLKKKIKLNIDFSVIGFEYNFCIHVNYFFDIITLYKEDIVKYQNKIRYKNKKIKIEDNLKKGKKKIILPECKVERILFKINVGAGDVFVTSMLIPILSTISAIAIQKYAPQSSKQFSIHPVYNQFFFSAKGSIYISAKTKDLLLFLLRIWWKRRKNNDSD